MSFEILYQPYCSMPEIFELPDEYFAMAQSCNGLSVNSSDTLTEEQKDFICKFDGEFRKYRVKRDMLTVGFHP